MSNARQLLARATEGTAAPTPGYLYKDLAQAATSNPSACQEMATYLTTRLQSKNNPNVKYKCLKVLAKLCEQVPRNQFRRCVSQHPHGVAAIKECLNFRGPLDPVRGDEPNAKVRQAAQEAIDAVYREAPSSEVAAAAASYGGAAPSYGASPHGGGGGGGYGGAPGVGGPRRMEGVGNPMYADPRLDPRWNNNPHGHQPANLKEAVKEAGEVVLGMIKDPLARNVDVGAAAMGVGGGGSYVPRQGVGELPGYARGGGGGSQVRFVFLVPFGCRGCCENLLAAWGLTRKFSFERHRCTWAHVRWCGRRSVLKPILLTMLCIIFFPF